MQTKANALLKYGVPVLVLGVIVVWLAASQQSGGQELQAKKDAGPQLTPQQMRILGIEAESPEDTIDTLVAEMHKMQKKLAQTRKTSAQLREQNKELAKENENLRRNLQQAIAQALAKQRQRYQQGRESLLDKFSRRLDQLRVTLDMKTNDNKQANGNKMPVGLGLGGDVPAGARGGLVWVDPLGTAPAGGATAHRGASNNSVSAFNTAFDMGRQAASNAANTVAGTMPGGLASQAIRGAAPRRPATTPVYTVPKGTTLTGSVAMSALLGRVPVDGTVHNPYPFKVVIGAENLVANGIMLPEIKGAIVSGTAIGDWTLSCVRGTVRSITFVFADGTVRTVPQPTMPGKGGNNNNNQGIGYLSNPQGLPCVPGTRKSNARKYILTQMLLSAGAAAAGAVAGGETTTSTSPLGSTTTVTGDIGRYIAGAALSEGINTVRKWFAERFGQTFDAVYVPPGQPVVVNITKPLYIDYEHNGRNVRYVDATRQQGLD